MSAIPHAVHYSTGADEWRTPPDFFARLDAEFGFTMDAAVAEGHALRDMLFGLGESNGEATFAQPWLPPYRDAACTERGAVYLNPPYSRGLQARFIRKAWEESKRGITVTCLIPARPDTALWHDVILPRASEIRFVRGRLRFVGAAAGAPFPSAVVVFTVKGGPPRFTTMAARP